MILSNITVPLTGAVDTGVVGHIDGAENLAGVAVGALIFSTVYFLFGFLRMSTTGFAAQALGAGDNGEIKATLGRSLVVALCLGCGLILLQVPLLAGSLWIVAPSESAADVAGAYFAIRIWGAPAALVNAAMLGWFFGVGNTTVPLIVQAGLNVSNAVLSLWFVLGLGFGIEGVATATLISEWAALGLWIVFARRHARRFPQEGPLALFKRDRLIGLFRANRDIFLRSAGLNAGFVVFTSLGARQGDLILAANAVLLTFQTFVAYGLDAFAHAAEALAGRAYGAGNRLAFRAANLISGLWALCLAVALSLALWFGGPFFISLLTDQPDVRETSMTYLAWSAFMPVVAVWCFQLDGIFIGATRTRAMRDGMALSLVLFLGAAFTLPNVMGNHGLWAALMIFMAARGGTLAAFYPQLEKDVGSRAKLECRSE
ncbi:MAG: MATE family efflux transporter [Magnetovibrionaceae bacterium]